MITYANVQEVLKFQGGGFPVTSLYLLTDRKEVTLDQMVTQAHSLLNAHARELLSRSLPHAHRESVVTDFRKIREYVEQLPEATFKGLAIFACSGKNFWQVYTLPQRVKNALIVDSDPYIRPLVAILNQYHRLAFLLVDRRRAQLFELFMGEIQEQTELISPDVPAKVRFAGWYGLEEKRVVRHIEQHIHEHFKRVAETLYQLYKTRQYDYFILSAQPHILPEFEKHLHTEIINRVIARLDVEPFSLDINQVKEKALRIEREFMEERLARQVEELVTAAKKDHRAVVGLRETLKAANLKAIRTLYIVEDKKIRGRQCSHCGYLTLEAPKCPICQHSTRPVADFFDELVEATLHMNGEYFTVPAHNPLSEYEGVGAWLRFKI